MCEIYKVIYHVEIVEGKDHLWGMRQKYFDKKRETAGMMVRMKNPIWRSGKVVIIDIGFYVLEWPILMVEKGVFGSASIKKCHYWTK